MCAPNSFIKLITLVDYQKLNFLDLEDLANLGDAYAKQLLKENIIASTLSRPSVNANILIQHGYFSYLDAKTRTNLLNKIQYNGLLDNSLRILAKLGDAKAKMLLEQ